MSPRQCASSVLIGWESWLRDLCVKPRLILTWWFPSFYSVVVVYSGVSAECVLVVSFLPFSKH